MKAVRITMYSPDLEAATIVAHEETLAVSIEELIETMPTPGALVICDPFETESEDITTITLEAEDRRSTAFDKERNMAIMYYWLVGHMSMTKNVVSPAPAPLSADDMNVVYEQLAKHPEYDGHRMVGVDSSGTIVGIADGELIAQS